MAESRLDRLVGTIGVYSSDNVFNPWRDSDPLDALERPAYERSERLYRHFDCSPEYLLIGEAPGYQGCHFAGIAFTNESLLLNGAVPRVEQAERITTRDRPWCEPSASIVWRELHKLGIAETTVMWNAFAWHPHKPGEPMSNRKPTMQELNDGRQILKAVCDYFAGAKIIAVGRVAEGIMQWLGITIDDAVRHPSMGGATKFREQMAKWEKGN